MTLAQRYTVRDTLWQALADDDRSMAWLAKRAACSEQKVRALKIGHNRTLSGTLAARMAAVLGQPVEVFFLPDTTTSVAKSGTVCEDDAA